MERFTNQNTDAEGNFSIQQKNFASTNNSSNQYFLYRCITPCSFPSI